MLGVAVEGEGSYSGPNKHMLTSGTDLFIPVHL